MSSFFYRDKSIKSVTYNTLTGKTVNTGELVRNYTTFRPTTEGKFGDMQVRELPTYGVKEKRTEITK